jgi:hypothetical protein
MLACPHLPLSRFEACLRHPNALRWRELECRSKGSARVPGLFFRSVFYLQIETKGRADERTRTADLISLRVISQALQGCAQVCKSRISKPVSFPCLALCCTVLRSRWCHSGVRRRWITRRRFLLKQIRDHCSITLFTEVPGETV